MSATPVLDHSNHVYTLSGQPLVSVSTVVSALIKKSWDANDPLTAARAKNAAERGSLVEQYTTELLERKTVTTRPNEREDVLERLEAVERWWLNIKPTFICAQRTVFSEIDRTAGTLDWILQIDGRDYIVDMKCTAQPERTWVIQLGAYLSMLKENPWTEAAFSDLSLAILHVNPKYQQGYIWREYDPDEAMMHWQRALAWYNSLQMLKAEVAE